MVFGEQGRYLAHAGDHGRKNGQLFIEWRFLRHISDAQARPPPELTVIQPSLTGQRGKQRRLATPVASDQRHLFAVIELKVGVIEQRNVTENERSVGK
jgi:hypothetical protein